MHKYLKLTCALMALLFTCAAPADEPATAELASQPGRVVVEVQMIDAKPAATQALLKAIGKQFDGGKALTVPNAKMKAFLAAVQEARKEKTLWTVNAPIVRTLLGNRANVSTADQCDEQSVEMTVSAGTTEEYQLDLRVQRARPETKAVIDSFALSVQLKGRGTFALLYPPTDKHSRVLILKVSGFK